MSELSTEQQYAYEQFTMGHNLFITGPGGTGKTKLIHHLVEHATVVGKKIQVCALTGCASLLLGCNAKTIHSWSGIKLAKGTIEQIIGQVMRNKCAKKNWNPIFSHTSAPPDLGLAVGWECLVEEAAPGDLLHVGTKALDNWIITC